METSSGESTISSLVMASSEGMSEKRIQRMWILRLVVIHTAITWSGVGNSKSEQVLSTTLTKALFLGGASDMVVLLLGTSIAEE